MPCDRLKTLKKRKKLDKNNGIKVKLFVLCEGEDMGFERCARHEYIDEVKEALSYLVS